MNRAIVLLLLLICPCVSQTNIQILAVANSADFQAGLPEAGSLASIFCIGVQGSGAIVRANSNPLPYNLAGVTVFINSIPAPILAVAFEEGYQQINVQVPWELTVEPHYVEVFQNGQGAATDTSAAGGNWSVFFRDATGHGLVQHAVDYSMVTLQNPAYSGEYLVAYATNLGRVINTPPSGYAAPLSPLSPLTTDFNCSGTLQHRVLLGDADAPVSFVGLTPRTVGVYQINFRVPPSISGDLAMRLDQSFVISSGGQCNTLPLVHGISRTVLVPVR
jgi:uncharacterized protein (TIGR03437 family)